MSNRIYRARLYNGNDDPYSEAPRYTLAADKAEDQWFFQTIRHNEPYNINVERDRSQHHIKVWFNVPIRDQAGKPLGISGSNLNLGAFLENFVKNTPAGITVMITDRRGLIQAHPDPNQIEYGSVGKEGGGTQHHAPAGTGGGPQCTPASLQ